MENNARVVIPTQTRRDQSIYGFNCIFCKKTNTEKDFARFVLVFISNEIKIDVKKEFICAVCSKNETSNDNVVPISNLEINLVCSMVKDILSLHGIQQKTTLYEACEKKLLPLLKTYNSLMLKRIGRLRSNCNFCMKSNPEYRCSGCNMVYYCSEKCFENDWYNKHKFNCSSLTVIADDVILIKL